VRQLVQDLRSGAVEVIDAPDPQPAANEVLVRTSWSLISAGTEEAVARTAARSVVGKALERPDQARQVAEKAWREGLEATAGAVRARLDDLLTPGYSSSGVVEAVGPGVEAVTVGQRVACFGANVACHAERVTVPAPLCLPLPLDLDDRWGAFGAVGGIAVHALRLAGVDAGSVVAVIGLGLVGQLATQLATAGGARAIGFDVSEERAELAMRLGAAGATTLAAEAERLVRTRSRGRGADAVLIAAATKDDAPLALAAELARERACVCVIGDVGMRLPRAPFYTKELELRISRSYGPGRYDRAYEVEGRDYPVGYVRWTERRLIEYFLEEAAAGGVRLAALVSHEFPIEEAAAAYKALSDPSRMAILLRYPSEPSLPRRRARLTVKAPARSGRMRLGLIGAGSFARSTLLPILRELDVELVGLAARSPARAVGVARRAGAAYAATSPRELFEDPEIDGVVIATRHGSHASLAVDALRSGKAVFVEKPLAIDEEGLDHVASLLGAETRLVVDFNRSLAPATRVVASAFSGRADPLFVSCRVNAGWLEPGHWLRDPAEGGGRLVGEGCHFVDLAAALVGVPLASLQVAPLAPGPTTLQGDNFVLTLRYADGSVASISYIASGDRRMEKERIEVLGAGRAATIEDFRGWRVHGGQRSRRPHPLQTRDKGHRQLLAAAIRFFSVGGEPPIPYERLVETTRATLMARRALQAGDLAPQTLDTG
jgi:predicted dehydrogenase